MPYREVLCGVYSISTPNGSMYVGSSNHIYRRWSEHRGNLRRGKHHSERLQAAWNKHGGCLVFKVLELCDLSELERLEQVYIDRLGAELNTTKYVNNVWCNPETRERLRSVHTSQEWREARRKIATKMAEGRRISVDCSNGITYASLSDAAKAFGVRASAIKHLVSTQRSGRLGVRFKLSTDDWRDVLPHYEQAVKTRKENGKLHHSEEARAKMRAAKVGFIPANKGQKHRPDSIRKMRESQKRIVVLDTRTGVEYPSVVDASKGSGVARTHVRRLMDRGERFVKLDVINSVSRRLA